MVATNKSNGVAVPEEFHARAIVYPTGTDTGSISVEVGLPPTYSSDDVQDYLRLELPGEVTLLSPNKVTGEDGHFVVGFISSDVANSGQMPAGCNAVWLDENDAPVKLMQIPITNSAEIAEEAAVDVEDMHAPGAKSETYPRTVGVAAVLAVLIGGLVGALFLLLN